MKCKENKKKKKKKNQNAGNSSPGGNLISVPILSPVSSRRRFRESLSSWPLRLSLQPRLHVRLVNVDVRPEPGSGLCHVSLHHSVQQKYAERKREVGVERSIDRVKAIPARLQRPTLLSPFSLIRHEAYSPLLVFVCLRRHPLAYDPRRHFLRLGRVHVNSPLYALILSPQR